MKKCLRLIILTFLLVLTGRISTQILSPFVVSSSGGFYSNTSGMLCFTTAEMSALQTFTSPSFILTQGFQQTWDFGTNTTKYPSQHFSFGIYPNPTGGQFNLFIDTELNQNIDVKILDLLGKVILKTSYYHESGINVESIDLSFTAPGIYIVALTVKENNNSPAYHSTKKIHIVK